MLEMICVLLICLWITEHLKKRSTRKEVEELLVQVNDLKQAKIDTLDRYQMEIERGYVLNKQAKKSEYDFYKSLADIESLKERIRKDKINRQKILEDMEKVKKRAEESEAAIRKCNKDIIFFTEKANEAEKRLKETNSKIDFYKSHAQDLDKKIRSLIHKYGPIHSVKQSVIQEQHNLEIIKSERLKNESIINDLIKKIKKAEDEIFIFNSGVKEDMFPILNSKTAEMEIKRIKSQISEMVKDGTLFSYCGPTSSEVFKNKKHENSIKSISLRALNEAHALLAWKIKAEQLEKSVEQLNKVAASISYNLTELCGYSFSKSFIMLKAMELEVFHAQKVVKAKEEEALKETLMHEREIRKAEEAARKAEQKEKEAKLRFELELNRAQQEEEKQKEIMDKIKRAAECAAAEEREAYAQRIREMEEKAARGSAEAAEAIRKLEAELKEAQDASIRATAMASLTRTGYVYIISNEGSFGEDVVKIGLTRRIEPQERIKELSGASVPFPFDVHMMLFSEDAPMLEAALHSRFDEYRVNTENRRKEFFRVDLDQVEKAVAEIEPNAVFTKDVHSTEWLRTVQKRNVYLGRVAANTMNKGP